MHVRLDADIARIIKRNADAHRRLFKRRKSYATIVNTLLRELLTKQRPAMHTP